MINFNAMLELFTVDRNNVRWDAIVNDILDRMLFGTKKRERYIGIRC